MGHKNNSNDDALRSPCARAQAGCSRESEGLYSLDSHFANDRITVTEVRIDTATDTCQTQVFVSC